MTGESEGIIRTGGCFYYGPNQRLVHLTGRQTDKVIGMDPNVPDYEGRIERVDYVVVTTDQERGEPRVMMVGGLHGDEWDILEKALETMRDLPWNRVEAWNTHVLASIRGLREAEVPPEQGNKVDLNREFKLEGDEKSIGDILARLNYPEAKLMVELMRKNPGIEQVFSFHEDTEYFPDKDDPAIKPERYTRGGFYVYDIAFDGRNDPQQAAVRALVADLVKELASRNFKIHHGPDDPNDPVLGSSDDGYNYQPVRKEGKRNYDNSYEAAVVEMGGLGLNKVKRAFAFDIPAELSAIRKMEMLAVIKDSFIRPYLEMSVGKI